MKPQGKARQKNGAGISCQRHFLLNPNLNQRPYVEKKGAVGLSVARIGKPHAADMNALTHQNRNKPPCILTF